MNKFELSSPEVKTMVCDLLHQIEYEYSQEYKYELDENCKLSELLQKKQQELERYKNIIDKVLESVCCIEHNLDKYEEIGLDHLEYAQNKIAELKEYLIELKGE